ncbi:Hsp20/alpha crystallin family protein [Granulosicoccaceae sp. 1_MG-2023]|nr:Hsp20/alpha crystallin family protein [Granulosicoccaceae sp. 1_MG-2023]
MTDSINQNQNTDVSVTNAESGIQEKRSADDTSVVKVRPLVDVREDQDGIALIAELPGVTPDQLSIEIDSDMLLIEGAVDPALSGGRPARFSRRFTLSRELDTDAVEAKLNQGLLTLRIPKRAEVRPRRIEVRAA